MKIVGGFMAKTLRTLYCLGKNKYFYDGQRVSGVPAQQIPEYSITNANGHEGVSPVEKNESLGIMPMNPSGNTNPVARKPMNSMTVVSSQSEDKNHLFHNTPERSPKKENIKFQGISRRVTTVS
jgi:hypothetical protein